MIGRVAEVDSLPNQRARGWRRWLNYSLQLLWVATLIFVIQLLALSARPGYIELMRVCTEPVCLDTQLTPVGMANLERLGISTSTFALVQLLIIYGLAAIYATVSVLIFRAKRNDTVALYTALILLLYGTFVTTFVDIFRMVQPWLTDLFDLLPGLTLIGFAILSYIFPDGRFVPGWTRWAAWGWVLAPAILVFGVVFDFYEQAFFPVSVLLLLLMLSCIIAPVYRYRRLSTYRQRQQLKWVLFGWAQLLTTLLIGVELLPHFFPLMDVVGTLPNMISFCLQVISIAILPITIGIALLRHRLWNVDLVINRTLVYVPLTSILTVIYSTSMAVSQRLFATATGEQSQAVAIFTTIVLTSTFSPIRNALQSYVDKNFKEAPGNLRELKEINSQLSHVIQALDHKALAQRVVETIVKVHRAKGAALYLHDHGKMSLAYATPDWVWADGEVSILLYDDPQDGAGGGEMTGERICYGRLLLGQRTDRDDYLLSELTEIRQGTLPIARNICKLLAIQADDF